MQNDDPKQLAETLKKLIEKAYPKYKNNRDDLINIALGVLVLGYVLWAGLIDVNDVLAMIKRLFG